MKKAEAISILAASVRPREAKDRARYDEAARMAIEALKCSETPKSSERTSETAQADHIADTGRKVEQTGEIAQNVQNGDLIQRKTAIEALRKCQTYLFDERDLDKKIELRSAEWAIEDLPSAQPERKRGQWEMLQMPISPPVYKCSVCGSHALQSVTGCLMNRHYEANLTNYCPNCGARMEVDDGSD